MNSLAIINICKKYKANAIHPGYGLLSENAAFVELVEKNNLIFCWA
jgi:acetyl/propionyl-CoA carboxylase alpha subunit